MIRIQRNHLGCLLVLGSPFIAYVALKEINSSNPEFPSTVLVNQCLLGLAVVYFLAGLFDLVRSYQMDNRVHEYDTNIRQDLVSIEYKRNMPTDTPEKDNPTYLDSPVEVWRGYYVKLKIEEILQSNAWSPNIVLSANYFSEVGPLLTDGQYHDALERLIRIENMATEWFMVKEMLSKTSKGGEWRSKDWGPINQEFLGAARALRALHSFRFRFYASGRQITSLWSGPENLPILCKT